jgi:hypothetical protein
MTDPCNYAGAFWNGVVYLVGGRDMTVFQCFVPVIAVVVLASGFYLYCKFTKKNNPGKFWT